MNPIDSVLQKVGAGMDNILNSIIKKFPANEYKVENPMNQVSEILNAIAHNETGGVKGDRYAFRKPSGNPKYGDDIGKYQVTGGELASWSKQFLGETIDPDDFAASPELQDAYMKKKVQTLLDEGATTSEIFALHRQGLTGYADPEVRKSKLAKRQDYVTNAVNFMNKK